MDPILLKLKLKLKMKNKYKYTVVNYISEDVFDVLKQQDNLHPLIKQLNLEGFNSRELSMFFVLRSLLFCITKQNPSVVLSYSQLKTFLSNVLTSFYQFNKDGYVNQQNMELNKIFNVFRSFYPYYKDVFTQNKTLSWNHELEHFHNLIILILLFEIEVYIKYFSLLEETDDTAKDDNTKETVCLLKEEKSLLLKTLSGGIRASLSKNRLVVIDRIYIGFDTEYKNVDSQTNNILCYTTASITESILKIRSSAIDYSLKEGKVYLPKTAVLISTGIKLIRLLRLKKDRELEKLESSLNMSKDLERIILNNQDVIYKQKTFDVKKIRSEFHDVRTDKTKFSLFNLLDRNINSGIESIPKKFSEYFNNLALKPVFRPECYLIAHFTTADVSLFSDFEQIKSKFTVLNKSFLTLNSSFSFKKWKVILRDSSLLSPAGMSLKSIGSLYPDLPLEKIELGSKNIQNMDQLFEKDEKLFKSYAIQDSKIVLWHSLQVLNSHFFLTGKYSIPVTLSSLASSYLKKRLIDEENSYHPTTKNGLISVKNLAKLNTPIGIELSGDLHEYIDYFLGSYHGGRNESYIYGVKTGEFYDYDLPGAYPTAMAMLDYPD